MTNRYSFRDLTATKTVFSGFWDGGRLADDNRVDYEGLNLTIDNDLYEVGVGDTVMLRAASDNGNATTQNSSSSLQRQHQAGNHRFSDYRVHGGMEQTTDYYSNNKTNSISGSMIKEAKVGDGLMLARVERIWQEKGRGGRTGKILFQARWFLKKEDVDALPLDEITGPVSCQGFAERITEHDLILSNQSDDNHVTTICGLIQVLYRSPNADQELPSHILPTTYICRYSLSVGETDDQPAMSVSPYTGENDEWHDMTLAAVQKKASTTSCTSENDDDEANEDEQSKEQNQRCHHKLHRQHQEHKKNTHQETASLGNTSSSVAYGPASGDESDIEMSIEDPRKKRKRGGAGGFDEGIDEGTTEQRYIRVGKDHQVHVPPFIPNQKSLSRHPTMVWKPGMISQEGIDEYMAKVSTILTPYLRDRRLTQEEPYAPFPTSRMEELSQSLSWNRLPTLSSVSTASLLCTTKIDALREFDTDALLRNLHTCNYNAQIALAAVMASPRDYLTVWTPQEKNVFDAGFRRYNGSLRAIYKGMGNKDLQDVIDYHYRFKIPDQYRRFQERKREQALRMLECIETRRSLNAPILMPNSLRSQIAGDETRESGDWFRTGNSSVATSMEDRRTKAKQLLLDVESQLGKNKVLEVFKVIRDSNDNSLVDSKTRLLEILRGHKDLQSRFLEFLPRQLRL